MGAFVIIVGVLLMVVVHEAAHFVAAKAFGMKATEAFFGFGPRLWSMQRGETEYGIKAVPLGGYVRIIGMNPFEEVAPEDVGRTYRENPFWKKSVVVLAGIASHFVVAFVIFAVVALAWGVASTDASGDPIPTTTVGGVVATLDDEATPASRSGVRRGDIIVSFNGVPITTWAEFGAAAAGNPGETVVIGLVRDGEDLEVTTTLTTRVSDGIEQGFFGVSPAVAIESVGPVGAVSESADNLWFAATQSVRGLRELVVGFPRVIGAAFGGDDDVLDTARPISVIGLVRYSGPLQSSLLLLAYVNVFVGVLNVVPLYPLDGGHFAVALYEKIRGRSADVRKLLPVAAAVFAFIVLLGLLGFYFDIVDPLQLPE
jgi:membrane-associated protease RseP (regulator of RpoE activity)